MPSLTRLLLATACVAGLTTSHAFAGAWPQKAGETQTITTVTVSRATEEFDGNGNNHGTPRFRKESVELYGEYGIDDETTLITKVEISNLHPEPPAQSASGFGNTEIGVRRQIWHEDDQVFSLQGSVLLPGRSLLTSEGTDAELRALYGYSFPLFGYASYIDAELAYRLRTNGYKDEIRPDLTLGVRASRNWLLLLQSLNVFSSGDGSNLTYQGRQHKLQLSAVRRLTDSVSFQFGGFTTVAGSHTPAERAVIAAIWINF